MSDFVGFPKISRYSRECIITEKIDGTNGQIYLIPIIEESWAERTDKQCLKINNFFIFVGSKSRWITPENDNHGFAKWAYENAEELSKLGMGRHFGEWWGQGIQRNYGLKEKRFSLFNVRRWGDPEGRPKCCHVVPVINEGLFETQLIENALEILKVGGSLAVPGFLKPEGVVIYHVAGNLLFKKTLEKDEKGKGEE